MWHNLILAIFALVGLLVSVYIYFKKSRGEKLYCFIGKDCNDVVNSEYNRIFGVQNEIFGILYFTFTLLYFSIMLLMPALADTTHRAIPYLNLFVLLLTAGAAIFSAYLIFVQAFVLRKFCEWCLTLAMMSILIFVFVLF